MTLINKNLGLKVYIKRMVIVLNQRNFYQRKNVQLKNMMKLIKMIESNMLDRLSIKTETVLVFKKMMDLDMKVNSLIINVRGKERLL